MDKEFFHIRIYNVHVNNFVESIVNFGAEVLESFKDASLFIVS